MGVEIETARYVLVRGDAKVDLFLQDGRTNGRSLENRLGKPCQAPTFDSKRSC